MFRYYEGKPEVPLYEPDFMRDFCEKNAPGLFDLLLKSITRDDDRVSVDREWLQRQRTVSLLHILSYFRFVIASVEFCLYFGILLDECRVAVIHFTTNSFVFKIKLHCIQNLVFTRCVPNEYRSRVLLQLQN